MPEGNRGIGSEGLEQGGPSLGNDYARADLSTREAGNALTSPDTTSKSDNDGDKDTLNMDDESSRNLEDDDDDDDLDEDLDDEMEDDDDEDDDDDVV